MGYKCKQRAEIDGLFGYETFTIGYFPYKEHRKQVLCGAERSDGLLKGNGALNAHSFIVKLSGKSGGCGVDSCNVIPLNESYRPNMSCENHWSFLGLSSNLVLCCSFFYRVSHVKEDISVARQEGVVPHTARSVSSNSDVLPP